MAKTSVNGNWIDSTGIEVPLKYVKPEDKKRDALVEKLIKRAKRLSCDLTKFKADALEDIDAFIETLEKQYQVKSRTKEGCKMLTGFSGDIRVELKINKVLEFDEKLAIAKSLIDECIANWCQGANDNIKLLVNDAFAVDKKQKLDRERIMGLRRLNIRDEKWKKAMDLIADSLRVSGRRAYIQFFTRDEKGLWRTVPLDISRA